jgi:hypothetical protein
MDEWQDRPEELMVVNCGSELQIEDVRHHPVEMVAMLRNLLCADGATVTADPKRAGFYEVESGEVVYYINVSPTSGKILLLATWPAQQMPEAVHQVA